MGTDFQRTLLWVFFGMSIVMLWDRWQVYNGKHSMFGMSATTQQAKVDAPPAPPKAGDVPAAVSTATPNTSTAQAVPSGAIAPAAKAAPVDIDTDVMHVVIDPEGAVVSRLELVKERVPPDWHQSGLVGLVLGKKQDKDEHIALLEVAPDRVYVAQSGLIGPAGSSFPTHRTRFTKLDGPTTMAEGQNTLDVKFAAESGGVKLTKTYSFTRDSYDVKVTHEVQNISGAPVAPTLYLQLVRDGNKPEGESGMYSTYYGAVIYTDKDKFHKISYSDIEKGKTDYPKSGQDGWIALVQHYFVTAWVPPAGMARDNETATIDKNLYAVRTKIPLGQLAPGASNLTTANLYAGPQDQNKLKAISPGLNLVVDYGWQTVIAQPIYELLEFLHGFTKNWGFAIILLTVIIKAAFYPLSAASYKSMARMKELTPRMTKLREQYGDDKQKLNVAMMELYKTEKINPLGGCLPIVIQIPVFLSLYSVLLASVEIRNQPWIGWIHDLATPDPWFILPVLMMGTMWFQYKLNPTPPDPVQAKITAIMPFVFGVMFFLFPAGLVLYWLTNNVLSIAQQAYVTKKFGKAKPVG